MVGVIRPAALVTLSTSLLGCASKVHFTVLDAADLTLPPEVRVIGVADRTGVPEGAAAVHGFTRWLDTTDRFAVAGPDQMADVTVVVEGFHSETDLALEEALAIRTSRVVLTWRLLDSAGTELDSLADVATADRWSATREEGVAVGLPTPEETIAALAESSGVAYARRLTAGNNTLVRDTYVRGDPRLRFARVAVRAGDWERAMRLWTEVARSPDPALAARGHYDLAVGYEVEGEVRRALDHAHQAAALDDGERISRYRDALDQVNGDQRPLRPADGDRAGQED